MQQLSFEAPSHTPWLATLAISGAWALAYLIYRLARWRHHEAPRLRSREPERPTLARVEGTLMGVDEFGVTLLETGSGVLWRLLAAERPTRLGTSVIAHGIEMERLYRGDERTLEVRRLCRAWPALRGLELPTVLVCLVHLVTAVALLGDAVI